MPERLEGVAEGKKCAERGKYWTKAKTPFSKEASTAGSTRSFKLNVKASILKSTI